MVKEALSIKKKDKNGVTEICIKPDVTDNGLDVNECWTVETTVPQPSNTDIVRVKGSASSSERTGSAESTRSNHTCVVEDFLDEDDGIETIFDAEYQGGAL